MRYDDTYSRVIAWLKIILPLGALAMLSTVFLAARTIDPAQNLPYADVDPGALMGDQRIGRPSYAGVTRDGAAVQFQAAVVRPEMGDPRIAGGTELDAQIELPDGTDITLYATDGVIDGSSQTAELGGGVVVTTSTGYRVETDRLAALLDITRLESAGQITGNGPPGVIEAGKMVIAPGSLPGQYVLVFNQGVKLIYDPQHQKD